MKLKLEYLSSYLPYGVKVQFEHDNEKLTGVLNMWERYNDDNPDGFIDKVSVDTKSDKGFYMLFFNEIKPILKPLSDLTEENFENIEYLLNKELSADLMWHEWEYLFENHYDVFNLIENNLAIDINTFQK